MKHNRNCPECDGRGVIPDCRQLAVNVPPSHFQDILDRKKRFEVLRDYPDFRVGDILYLSEFDEEKEAKTGRVLCARVTFKSHRFIQNGYCALGISLL